MANPRTTLANLPAEIHSLIIQQIVLDIENNHRDDLDRWSHDRSNDSPSGAASSQIMQQNIHTEAILHPKHQLHDRVKVTLGPLLGELSQSPALSITVLIPRKWHEILLSGIFQDSALSQFTRNMTIEIVNGTPLIPPSMQFDHDFRTENAVREMLTGQTHFKIHDLNLYAFRATQANLQVLLPRMQQLDIFHEEEFYWFDDDYDVQHRGYIAKSRLHFSHDLHSIDWKDIKLMEAEKQMPIGLDSVLKRRESHLRVAARWNQSVALTRRRIQEELVTSGWTGSTHHCITVRCIAPRSSNWTGFDMIRIQITFEYTFAQQWALQDVTYKHTGETINWHAMRQLKRLSM